MGADTVLRGSVTAPKGFSEAKPEAAKPRGRSPLDTLLRGQFFHTAPSDFQQSLSKYSTQTEAISQVDCSTRLYSQVSVPVLVLHSDDDPVVPASLGQRLVDTVREQGKEDVQIVR